jgi:hypothetical protein
LEGVCVHWHLKKVCIANSIWGRSRESQCFGGNLCSLAFEESLYCLFYLRKITRISGPCKESVFTGIWRKVILVFFSNENHQESHQKKVALQVGC